MLPLILAAKHSKGRAISAHSARGQCASLFEKHSTHYPHISKIWKISKAAGAEEGMRQKEHIRVCWNATLPVKFAAVKRQNMLCPMLIGAPLSFSLHGIKLYTATVAFNLQLHAAILLSMPCVHPNHLILFLFSNL